MLFTLIAKTVSSIEYRVYSKKKRIAQSAKRKAIAQNSKFKYISRFVDKLVVSE